MRYAAKWPQYRGEWDTMKINEARVAEFEQYAHFAISHKAQYQAVEAKTGVQWFHVAVIHRRESNADFETYLGNGQSLHRVTTEVPAGRGPFNGPDAFVRGCIDALHMDGLDRILDWRLEKILYYCEIFNGGGYDARGLPSPYLWGGTSIQRRGKYVRDRVFDPRAWDGQPGCAPIIRAIADIDQSVRFVRET
jgi:lysozyme family protein